MRGQIIADIREHDALIHTRTSELEHIRNRGRNVRCGSGTIQGRAMGFVGAAAAKPQKDNNIIFNFNMNQHDNCDLITFYNSSQPMGIFGSPWIRLIQRWAGVLRAASIF